MDYGLHFIISKLESSLLVLSQTACLVTATTQLHKTLRTSMVQILLQWDEIQSALILWVACTCKAVWCCTKFLPCLLGRLGPSGWVWVGICQPGWRVVWTLGLGPLGSIFLRGTKAISIWFDQATHQFHVRLKSNTMTRKYLGPIKKTTKNTANNRGRDTLGA